jgi:DNA-binding NarL/FixJ family response regulator
MHLQHLPLMAAARHADVVIWDLNQICFLSAEVNWALRYLAASVPVILITPFGADDTSRRAKALGVAAYLSKPFKLGDLGRDLCRILGQDGKRSPRARTG